MEKAISENSVFKIGEDVVFADLQGELVLLNHRLGKYFGLDAIGTQVWNLIKDGKNLAQIRDTIVAEYDVTLEQCQEDLQTLIHALLDKHLVEMAR